MAPPPLHIHAPAVMPGADARRPDRDALMYAVLRHYRRALHTPWRADEPGDAIAAVRYGPPSMSDSRALQRSLALIQAHLHPRGRARRAND
jgi:hypothetical protein